MILEVCNGERKSTNLTKKLAQSLHADVVPLHWKKYIVPDMITAPEWINDFKQRVEQLQVLSDHPGKQNTSLWFGGLLAPEAYLIAT